MWGDEHSSPFWQPLRTMSATQKIVMQIIDENNSVVMETDSYNFFNYKTTKEEV